MSLYYDAATVLTTEAQEGSLKSRIYGNRLGLRSKPAHLYALISETAKYDTFLKEVIDNAGFLPQESKLTPILCILLVHDFLFAKGGVAASSAHPLRQAIERHKTRLHAEFTKGRVRRKCTTVEELKSRLLSEKPGSQRLQPRWIRVNRLRTTLHEQLSTTFEGYTTDATMSEVAKAPGTAKILAVDKDIPDLIAAPAETDVTRTEAYRNGDIILQDKASCFPAYMLLGGQGHQILRGDCFDGCAAPGNKTSHLAALLASCNYAKNKIYACERDQIRSKTLETMMEKTGAGNVTVLAGQDFLALDPRDARFTNVTHLLLDPSCSGSGILGREDIPSLALPVGQGGRKPNTASIERQSKKRKWQQDKAEETRIEGDASQVEEVRDTTLDRTRLSKLSALQTKIVEHALCFPAATRVTYSTCSVHVQENEAVVSRVLAGKAANSRNWRVLRREEQPIGLRQWKHRGIVDDKPTAMGADLDVPTLSEEQLEACVRCYPGGEEGTMGFFVCGFVRSSEEDESRQQSAGSDGEAHGEWNGFSD